MTELERRALLGDKQAQEECTGKGIVLPCPLCGREITTRVRPEKCAVTLSIICFECRIEKSVRVEMIDAEFRKFENEINNLINNWNTRPAPPIGRCKDCKHLDNTGKHPVCWHTNMPIKSENDFCNYYEAGE